jgi:HlyD family secretion protein
MVAFSVMRRWAIRIGVLAVLVALGVVLRLTVFAPEPVAVTVATAERGQVEEAVTNTRAGTVRARRRAKLSPEVGGLVVELPYREGERVAAGAVLLRLEPRLPAAEAELAGRELRTAEARRAEACVAAEGAARERARLERLAAEGIVSESLLDQAVTAAESSAAACAAARATVEGARSAVSVARTRVDQLVLRAPFDGVIADLFAEVGEWITPAPPAVPVPPVLDLIDPSSIYVSAPMDEVDAGVLAPGLPVRVTVDSRPGEELAGRIVRVASFVEDVEEQNRTVEIEVELADPAAAGTLLPGTSADVEVILEVREGVLRIPTSALLEGDRVLVVEGGVLVERAVEPGLSNWDWTEVRSGLEPGDEVVTSLDRTGVEPGAEVVLE